MVERRRFTRIIYSTHASLRQNDIVFLCLVKNVSLRGLLLTGKGCSCLDPQLPVTIHFKLPTSDINIYLTVKIISATDTELRVSIISVDIDSISQLKRLVELNLTNIDNWADEIERLATINNLNLEPEEPEFSHKEI